MRQTQELEHSMRTFSAAAAELARALDDDVAEERTSDSPIDPPITTTIITSDAQMGTWTTSETIILAPTRTSTIARAAWRKRKRAIMPDSRKYRARRPSTAIALDANTMNASRVTANTAG